MKNIKFVQKESFFIEAKKVISSVNTIMDIGCGIRPQQFADVFFRVCIDAHKEYLVHLENINNALPLRQRLRYLYFNKTTEWIISKKNHKVVDSIFLIDVIEHLNKEHGKDLVQKLTQITNHQIIIFTPLGFVEQKHPDGKDAWGLSGGKWQEHKSGWTTEDFDDTWEFIVCEDFHEYNNIGHKHDKSVGAFFAIKNLNKKPKLWSKESFLQKIFRIIYCSIYYRLLFR